MTLPVLKLRQGVQFPGSVEGTNGVGVSKANGTWTFETNWNDFGSINAIPTAPTSFILTFDTATQTYVLCPSHLLGGAVAGIADVTLPGAYARQIGAWVPAVADVSGAGTFARQAGTWVPAVTDVLTDSVLYGRKNGAWVAVPSSPLSEPPSDNVQYGRQVSTLGVASWTQTLTDAPNNTFTYGRHGAAWVTVTPEAPSDGNSYVRKSLGWVVASSSGGILDAPSDGKTYARKSAAWVDVGGGNIVNFGAIPGDPTKAAINSAAMTAAWVNNPLIYVPKGTFFINPTTAPASAVGIVGDTSGLSILTGSPTGTNSLLAFSSLAELYLRDFAVEILVTPSTTGISISGCTKVLLKRVRSRGYRAVFGVSNTNVTIDDCTVDLWSDLAIAFSTGDTMVVRNCTIAPTSAADPVGHAIEGVDYKRFHATNNLITSPLGFAISANGSGTGHYEEILINNNIIKGTGTNEAITIGHGAAVNSFQICNNIVDWTASTDLGITIVADGGTVKNGTIANNTITKPHGAAITLWGDVINTSISGNVGTFNSGGNTSTGAAISLLGFPYGAPHHCVVEGNNFVSETGIETYTYLEQNAGTNPTFNTFGTNYGTVGTSGVYLLIDGNGSVTWDGPFTQTSLTVTDITGAPIAGYAASVRTKVNGSKVFAHVIIIISNAAGASTQLRTALPVPSIVACAGSFGDITDGTVTGTALIAGATAYLTPFGGTIQNHQYIASFSYDRAT